MDDLKQAMDKRRKATADSPEKIEKDEWTPITSPKEIREQTADEIVRDLYSDVPSQFKFPESRDKTGKDIYRKFVNTLTNKKTFDVLLKADNSTVNELYEKFGFFLPPSVDIKNEMTRYYQVIAYVLEHIADRVNLTETQLRDLKNADFKKVDELKNELGGKLELWSTSNKTLIHERKIIFEELILSIDNSFFALNKNEPTWQITVSHCIETSREWIKKCEHFQLIR